MLIALALAALAQDPRPGLVAEYCDTGRGIADFPQPGDLRFLFLRRIEPALNHPSTTGTFADSKIADHFAVRWTGLLRVPAEAVWTFFLNSDDGSRLWIDGTQLIDNGGPHGMREKVGTIKLTAGDHPIAVEYADQGGAAGCVLSWSGPDRAKEPVPADVLFHRADDLDRPPAPVEAKLRWKLKPDQFARYRVYSIAKAEGGGDALSQDAYYNCGLFGYEIDDERAYHPRLQTAAEIPLILALTLPERPLRAGRDVDHDIILDRGWDYEPTHANAKVERLKSSAPATVTYSLHAKLAGLRAKVEGRQNRVKEGAVEAEVDVDADRGLVTRVRFKFVITYENGKPTEWIREMRLCDVLTRRHATFESEVNAAIDRGVERMWGWHDAKESHWAKWNNYLEGPSALALLTVLKGSLDRKDARLEKALAWLLEQPLTWTYSVGIAMMAVEAWYSPLDPAKRFRPGEAADKDIASKISPEHRKWMEEAAKWLLAGEADGYWAYPRAAHNAVQDWSNTQYAILGLLAAQRCGIAVDDQPLVAAVNRILQSQERKGPTVKLTIVDDLTPGAGTTAEANAPATGWAYRDRPEQHGGPRASMTLGCLGSLTILDHMLVRMSSTRYKPDLRQKVQAAIRSGWAWMAHDWSVKVNWNDGREWHFYTLYALERAAMLGGVGTINGRDWYWEGACWLVANMTGDGAWTPYSYAGGSQNIHETCFAVLFLKRATVRVATGEKK